MKRIRAALIAFAIAMLGYGAHAEEPYFADVPPCHWAADAVNRLAETGIFIGFPPEDSYLSVNALEQVFFGLFCEEPEWSLRFLEGAPEGFGQPPAPRLSSFELEPVLVELEANRAVIDFTVTLVLEEEGVQRHEVVEGTAIATGDEMGWRVLYESLATLEPTLFPALQADDPVAVGPPTVSATFRGD